MKPQTGQLWLGIFPKINTVRGQEWLWTMDSKGFGRFFSRKAGSSEPFCNEFASWPLGEFCNELGELVPAPTTGLQHQAQAQRIRRAQEFDQKHKDPNNP